jgi:hypothetical protein
MDGTSGIYSPSMSIAYTPCRISLKTNGFPLSRVQTEEYIDKIPVATRCTSKVRSRTVSDEGKACPELYEALQDAEESDT